MVPSEIKERIANGEYQIDNYAVAQAMLNRAPIAHWLTEPLHVHSAGATTSSVLDEASSKPA
jgi:hypothetical protein